jgi:hypothetical protein
MRRLLLLSFVTICLSIAIGCGDGKTPSNENVTIVIDSIETVNEDSLVADTTLSDSLKKDRLKADSLKTDSLKADSVANVSKTDSVVVDSTKAANQLEKTKTNKCSAFAAWIVGIICFILGVVLTLGSICLIKFIKKKNKKSKKSDLPVIQADAVSEVDKNDEILRDLIIEK